MPTEIEKKFLVKGTAWKGEIKGTKITQGYLLSNNLIMARVRVYGKKGYITLKGKRKGISRTEYEYEIPVREAKELLLYCEDRVLEKIRYKIPYKNEVFEVDEFLGINKGLVLAEIELKSEEQKFEKPHWLGKDVSQNKKYYNSNLVKSKLK
ncbi:MAG: hypothetical protein A2W91_10495 [Bacteroidetes bacterium GWF2_38_335]|nr:MAG: hypothetical protein A2W91_10495 [Bacteroidetes bacterium GWF2_38_335]OFY81867.1 MAG: hypothetical protein A2281_06545 [Bacteroidetes bacterium RIFOXYA12_FULL_38_20]HBS87944.1 adenylate cyclase [Bacteroidales bacterium]